MLSLVSFPIRQISLLQRELLFWGEQRVAIAMVAAQMEGKLKEYKMMQLL